MPAATSRNELALARADSQTPGKPMLTRPGSVHHIALQHGRVVDDDAAVVPARRPSIGLVQPQIILNLVIGDVFQQIAGLAIEGAAHGFER